MDHEFRQFYETLEKGKFKFFGKGEGYSVFNSDIEMIPQYNARDVIERKEMKELRLSKGEIEGIVRALLTEIKIGVQEYNGQVLVREGFPGNWKDFTDLLLDARSIPSIAAVKLGEVVEISFLITSESTIYTSVFEDDEIFSSLYWILSEVNVVEVVYDNKKLGGFFNRLGVSSSLRRCEENTVKLLCRYLRISEENYKCEEYTRPFICRIDRSVLSALNVCSDDEHCVAKTFCCYTNQGWRLLHRMFLQPLRNKDEIERRLETVDSLRTLNLNILKKFPDLLRLSKRIETGRISLREILRLIQTIDIIPELLSSFSSSLPLTRDFSKPLKSIFSAFGPFKEEIVRVVDLEAAEENVYRIRPDVSARLLELSEALGEIEKEMNGEYERVSEIYPKIKIDKNTGVFKTTKGEYQKAQDLLRKEGFVELNFVKGGVTLTTRILSSLNGRQVALKKEIDDEEKEVMDRIKRMLKSYISQIESLNYLTALIDVFNAFSIKASLKGYSRPMFNKGIFEIRNGFHPVLEDQDYISNSIRMEEKKMCVVTGPNMGGKSTFLKTCGVVALLAHIGCYVPADYASIPILDGIYARVGANDCSFTGSSTFMMEMADIARICRLSSSESLIIIDELGRGTSAIDGLSIAQAVKEHIVQKKALCLCATHFPELCGDDVLNKKVKNEGTLLMYEVVDGVCDTSFGIMVAEKVGFPTKVIETAKEYMEK
ncbi:DNA mismatch repair ATPase MutS [Encephalitozoon intestinalis ATCC 50506]|uniref:DNA mismatch repair ATPase MutS n=1 Tax=Encephalitozoon intestinalis (strain ATCC 50506) TaxID=876142 RepID=E0S654_ENCIT|nr:DNA mismatch repair ATPase MutS [Encephalitozoon intestinalis ATCC 50506]ADM11189.1 DNA mismatch repair ATPase MutS [Encephalitozoon intestinalis ATCC 50506]UTX44856.1 DNA mismatch repair protein Msh2 [Encephalitozoon intestinalis]